ncbi:MAG TPA: sensor histidine kinase KdpD [Coleofasciculaceae cyanobacterium]|jgi:two-component system sensor histidine kinase KdpD
MSQNQPPPEPIPNQLPAKELLEGILNAAHHRGHHKIIIGAAPGVGKTYRMLQEAHNLKRMGVDVVVGYLEPHGRAETEALLEGLEVVPRQKIPYKSILLEEMDKNAIIQRRPKTVLVDELAHTNVAGSEHPKRYEDVEDILKAGISVVSTVNIQHIESLNDIVTRITGIQVNERVPDSIIDAADEVVLVDISVEELQDRLKKGKIYAREKIEQALNNFFKKGNLVALRELALREVANSVEEQAQSDVLACPLEPTGVHERILVCISTHPDAQRLIRRGYRVADRMCGELIVLFVKLKGKKLSDEYTRSLAKHEALARELGGKFLEVTAVDIADAIVDIAKEQKITQIIVGESLREPGLLSFLKPALPYQIFEKTNHIDVYIVATGRE